MMFKFLTKWLFLPALIALFASCADDEEGTEFLFNREVMELSVIRGCADQNDTSACYRVRFSLPIKKDDLACIRVWLDTTVVDDTSKAVSSKQIDNSTMCLEYDEESNKQADTLDLTKEVKEFLDKDYDSLQVAFFCEYSDDGDPGAVQRVFLHFKDDLPPSSVNIPDPITWTDGAEFEWHRSTDQTDFYKPAELSGIIFGYNVVIYAEDSEEDLSNIKVILTTPEGVDSTGKKLYHRHARIRSDKDSVWLDSVPRSEKKKNVLRIAVLDGKGFDFDNDSLNRYSMVIRGLHPMSVYTIGIAAWDAVGNKSCTECLSEPKNNKRFDTTDSVAPVMATKLYFVEDTLFPGMARLDSNNRLRIFWNISVDPFVVDHPIKSDTVLLVPDTCKFSLCYDTVATYVIEHYDENAKEWKKFDYVIGDSARYGKKYELQKGVMTETTRAVTRDGSATGLFVTDTVRWVSPGDTIIFRIRSRDKSGYYSTALIDTVRVSPGSAAADLECPEGFVPVSLNDTTKFCMERYEHRNDSGEFVYNVLHSEAVAACEAVSASGFKVSLCKERDWELVCLSGGTLSNGVLVEESVNSAKSLFSYCNVGTNDSASAADISKRDYRCTNTMGVKDLPGQYQEWVIGKSEDTVAVVKGSSYKVFSGLDRESLMLCTNRSYPYFTRPGYTTDSVFIYREGAKVDTAFKADTSRTLYKVLTKKDFKDSLQFFEVQDASGNTIGEDYALYSEYKKGGDEWLDTLSNGLVYVPSEVKVVFLTGSKVAYRGATAFYKSPAISFRCCAYPE